MGGTDCSRAQYTSKQITKIADLQDIKTSDQDLQDSPDSRLSITLHSLVAPRGPADILIYNYEKKKKKKNI